MAGIPSTQPKLAEAAQARAVAQAAEREALKKRQVAENEKKALAAQIKARFPPEKLYRVPQDTEVARTKPQYREDHFEVWVAMLQRYPHPPRSDEERSEREAGFWQLYASDFTTKNADGKALLKPKQEILDFFENGEKWIYRWYYAATGIVKRTIQEEVVRVTVASRKALDMTPNSSYVEQERARTLAAFERLVQEQLPAHFQKEGEWFFFNVQEAFKRTHTPHADYGPQSATTPTAHVAQDDLSYRRNA